MKALLDWPGHAVIALPIRLYLGYVFVAACWYKISDPGAFALSIATYQFLPLNLINIIALIMPWTELCVGLMIVVGFRTRAAALLIVGLMLIFMTALGWALHQGLDMSCGCFVSSDEADPISAWTMLRDAGWLSCGLYVLLFDRRPWGIDRIWPRKAQAR